MNFKITLFFLSVLQGCGVKNDPIAPAGSKPLSSSVRKYTAKPIPKEKNDGKKEQEKVPVKNESQ